MRLRAKVTFRTASCVAFGYGAGPGLRNTDWHVSGQQRSQHGNGWPLDRLKTVLDTLCMVKKCLVAQKSMASGTVPLSSARTFGQSERKYRYEGAFTGVLMFLERFDSVLGCSGCV